MEFMRQATGFGRRDLCVTPPDVEDHPMPDVTDSSSSCVDSPPGSFNSNKSLKQVFLKGAMALDLDKSMQNCDIAMPSSINMLHGDQIVRPDYHAALRHLQEPSPNAKGWIQPMGAWHSAPSLIETTPVPRHTTPALRRPVNMTTRSPTGPWMNIE